MAVHYGASQCTWTIYIVTDNAFACDLHIILSMIATSLEYPDPQKIGRRVWAIGFGGMHTPECY